LGDFSEGAVHEKHFEANNDLFKFILDYTEAL